MIIRIKRPKITQQNIIEQKLMRKMNLPFVEEISFLDRMRIAQEIMKLDTKQKNKMIGSSTSK
jgi:hypothetical protein